MSNQYNLRQLRYFLEVATELHFHRAAEKLYISQSGLSRQIRALEKEIGFSLFKRSSRSVELTPAGQYLQWKAKRVINDLDEAIDHARQLDQGIQGELKLGYVGSAMHRVIPDLLIQHRESFPEIKYQLELLSNRRQIEKLIQGEIDIGFIRLNKVLHGLMTYPVHEGTFSLVLPSGHPIGTHNFRGVNQLKKESFILFDPTHATSYYDQVMSIFDESGFVPRVSHKTVDALTIYRLVENGFGISIIPTELSRGYNANVKFIELLDVSQRTTLSIVWKRENLNPVLQRFINLIKKYDIRT